MALRAASFGGSNTNLLETQSPFSITDSGGSGISPGGEYSCCNKLGRHIVISFRITDYGCPVVDKVDHSVSVSYLVWHADTNCPQPSKKLIWTAKMTLKFGSSFHCKLSVNNKSSTSSFGCSRISENLTLILACTNMTPSSLQSMETRSLILPENG